MRGVIVERMRNVDLFSRIEIIDREDSIRLLHTQEVGRLAFLNNGEPDVLPVNYVMDGDAIVFATAAGPKFRGASRGMVAFEVDHLKPAKRAGWSVVVHGLCQEVTLRDQPALIERVALLPISPWAGGDRPHILRLVPHTISGRRVGSE